MTSQWEAQVIGINYYPSYTGLSNLTAAANDAEAIATQLETYGYQTVRVQRLPRQATQKGEWQIHPKEGVTRQELREAISHIFQPPAENTPEMALFYFSGHGWPKTVNGREEVFLATSDVLPDEGVYGITVRDLGKIIQESRVKKVVVWLDCCYSGELIDYIPDNKDYCFITATRSYELGIEVKHEGGLFTKTLLEGLNPDNYPDGIVDSHKLAKFVQERMAQTGQAPQYANSQRSIPLMSKFPKRVFKDECPYRSLSYFTEKLEDAQVFCGRSKLTQDLVEQVRAKKRLIGVFGASGSGKSSLLRAGLLYQLKLGQLIPGSNNWTYIEPLTPTDKPFEQLEKAIANEALTNRETPLNRIIQSLAADQPLILIIDQFEECFTMCDENKRKAFINCLIDLINDNPNLQIIIGMRSDFRGRLREFPNFSQNMTKINVGHLNREEIREVIEKPADFVGLGIEGALKQQLINDVEDYPGSLPLLQYTLTELWYEAHKQGEKFLRLETYQELGGIEGTLEKRAEQVYESLGLTRQLPLINLLHKSGSLRSPKGLDILTFLFLLDYQKVAKRIFLELTQVGDTLDTRRRVSLGDLVNSHYPSLKILEQVVQKLASSESRLIIMTESGDTDEDKIYAPLSPKKGENPKSKIIIDVVHEALIRHWKRLGDWKQEYRDAMVIERKIEVSANEWAQKGRKNDDLLSSSRLVEAEGYLNDFGELGMLDGVAEEFIEESQNLRNRLKKAARKTMILVVSAGIMLLGLGVFAIIQSHLREIAVEQKKTEVIKTAWLSLDKSKKTVEAFKKECSTELPGIGIRGIYCLVIAFIDYQKMEEISGLSVFIKGPHRNGVLNLDSPYEFGYYNKNFVIWLKENIIPADKDKKDTQKIYDRYFKKTARAFYKSHQILLYQENKNYLEAEKKYYLSLLKSKKTSDYYLFNFETRLKEQAKRLKSLQQLESLLEIDPKDINGLNKEKLNPAEVQSAIFFWTRRSIDETEGEFFLLLEKLMQTYDAKYPYFFSAINNDANGKYDQAISDFTQVINYNPNDDEAYYYRGITYTRKDEYDLAITDFTKVIELMSNDNQDYYHNYIDTYYRRGLIYAIKQDYDSAIADFTQVIDKSESTNFPNKSEAYYNRGLAYKNKGSKHEAVTDFQQVLELGNNDELVQKTEKQLQELGIK